MKSVKALSLVVLVVCAVPSFAAYDAFLKIGDIKGESTDVNHRDWIAANTFIWFRNQTAATGAGMVRGGGGNTAACATNELRFSARDKSVPNLMQMVASGKHFPQVTVDVQGQQHVLEDAILTSANVMGDGSANFSLKFARCATHVAIAPVQRVAAASMLNPNSTNATNGQLFVGNDPAESLNLLGVRSQDANSLIIVVRGASSRLMLTCASGKHYPSATITCRKAGGENQQYIKITMQDVLVSSNQRNPDGTTSIGLRFKDHQGSLTGLENMQ